MHRLLAVTGAISASAYTGSLAFRGQTLRTGSTASALLLVRHGERMDYVDPTWVTSNQGQQPWNPPLTETGQRQAKALAHAVEDWCAQLGLELGAVYSSPLLRTQQTAQPTATHFGLEVTPEPGLMEWLATEWYTSWACADSTGHWGSGTPPVLPSFAEVVNQAAEDFIASKKGPKRSMANPESSVAMVDRTVACIEELALRHPGKAMLVVGHSGPMQYSSKRLASEVDPSLAVSGQTGYTGIYVLLRIPGGWKLVSANDLRHLSRL